MLNCYDLIVIIIAGLFTAFLYIIAMTTIALLIELFSVLR